MLAIVPMEKIINQAIEYRKAGQHDNAKELLSSLLRSNPKDPILNYQYAWTCDSNGDESEAVTYYETAIENGLAGEDRRGAMLGLGSTYRCLGRYDDALRMFDQAVSEFPQDRSFKVFRAIVYYNLGHSNKAVGELLIQLLETTNDSSISEYKKALTFYADKLDNTWG